MLLDTPICDFGWQAPDFTLKDANGKTFSMHEQMGEKGLLIAFICNHCPYVKAIIERFSTDATQLIKAGVNVIAVMPNDYQNYPDDSPQKMLEFSAKHQLSFPYLVDQEQAVAKAYGAVCTPDFFGLNRHGELQYRGRIDDAKMGDSGKRTPELVNAMLQIAQTDQGPQQQQPSMGCSIKWKNK